MATIVTRAGKGTPLTNTELDANFTNLNSEVGGKAAAAHTHVKADITDLSLAWNDITGKPTTFTPSAHTHDAGDLPSRTDWSTRGGVVGVVGQVVWRNYGNGHTIFDASASVTPTGTGCSNTDPVVAWTGSYPTLMGFNGTNTYGVRVDRARYAEEATGNLLTALNGKAASSHTHSYVAHDQGYNVVGGFVLAKRSTVGTVAPNATAAGSTLNASDANGNISGSALAGTWRCLGNISGQNMVTLWQRIS